jgi:hypothetical protein
MATLNRGRRSLSTKVIKPAKGLLDAEASDHKEDQEFASPKMLAEFALANPDAVIGIQTEAIPSVVGALAPSLDVSTVEGAADGMGPSQVVGASDVTPSIPMVSIKESLPAGPLHKRSSLLCMYRLSTPGRFKQPEGRSANFSASDQHWFYLARPSLLSDFVSLSGMFRLTSLVKVQLG